MTWAQTQNKITRQYYLKLAISASIVLVISCAIIHQLFGRRQGYIQAQVDEYMMQQMVKEYNAKSK